MLRRAPDSQSEEASTHDVLDADKTKLFRSAATRLNCWAVDSQNAVRACSKSISSPRANDWPRLKRVARCVKGCPDTGTMFERQTAPRRLVVQSDID